MNARDFSADHRPTRGQHEQIAREFARLAGEPYPKTRLAATELLLRLRTTETPDPPPRVAQPLTGPLPRPRARAPFVSVSAQQGQELAEHEAQAFYDRQAAREPRGGYNAGHRCYACHRFIAGPEATCAHCGYRHGGVNHRAQATR